MRSVLFTIAFDAQAHLGPLGRVPVFGLGLLLALWCLVGLAWGYLQWRKGWSRDGGPFTGFVWLLVAAFLIAAPRLPFKGIPIYGYGTMLFLGVIASSSFAAWRLRKQGADGNLGWDGAMWLLASGIVGGRVYYVLTHADQFFGPDERGQPRSLGQILLSLINLPDGGLVLYGALIFAVAGYVCFCRVRRISALAFGDIAIASVFVGIMFGRIGCLLHGCCYGDICTLPWGMEFPAESVPFKSLVLRGLLASDQPHTVPLHPTQLYDSLNAALLALLTYACYPFRRRSGEVLAIGWVLYPVNRFLIEFLRSDEPTVFGTGLTGAQWVSVALFGSGLAFLAWVETRPGPLELQELKSSRVQTNLARDSVTP